MALGLPNRVLIEIEYDSPIDETTVQMLADSQRAYEGVVSVSARVVHEPYVLPGQDDHHLG